jgi:hypothetical protein
MWCEIIVRRRAKKRAGFQAESAFIVRKKGFESTSYSLLGVFVNDFVETD